MKKIIITQKEIYDAMRPSVQKNKKKYTRKLKHKMRDQ
jgi:membrane-anchored glycerophosphoryl diester phosphodiesterase (GDPDase)